MMPTQAQMRAAKALFFRDQVDDESALEARAAAYWQEALAAEHICPAPTTCLACIREEYVAKSTAVLLAGRPTPEEHERGIEAAMKWMEGIALGTPEQFVRGVIAAYLAATGGGNG